jgi:hypothetical protein
VKSANRNTPLEEKEPTTAITTVGVVTRTRLTSLTACLESFLENCRRHDRRPDFVITDDSADANAQRRTRAALKALADRFGATIRYAGLEERNRFAEALTGESRVPPEIVRFALFGDDCCALSTGANRNGLQLDTGDALVLSVDDDTLCRIAVPPDSADAPTVFSGYDPTEFWFFPDRASAVESASFAEVDVLGCHEQLLGKAAADIAGSTDEGGRVAITLHGLVGDSGMGSPRYYLSLTGASRERLIDSPSTYQSAFRSRAVVRAVRRPTIAASPFCMTTFFGFDNRLLLPPFFPVQRNSDGIFGFVLRKCLAASRVAFLPSVLLHAPPVERTFEPDEISKDAGSVRMADILIACVLAHKADDPHLTDAERLVQLGRHLQWLGSLTLLDFEAYVRSLLQSRVMAFTTILQSHLQTYGASPGFWADDVNRLIALMSQTATEPGYVTPRDLRDRCDTEEARGLSQELVARFGELLEAWPTIVSAATRLRMNGRRLTDSVQDVV